MDVNDLASAAYGKGTRSEWERNGRITKTHFRHLASSERFEGRLRGNPAFAARIQTATDTDGSTTPPSGWKKLTELVSEIRSSRLP